ncbi:MAG: polymer-forming cytoskeletal protein [Chloroflexota bacterium]
MKPLPKLFSALALLALLLIPASPALAKGPLDGGPVIFGGNFKLESGDTLNSDLVVFGGNVEIEVDAVVKGSIVVFGGTVTMDGTTEGDIVLIGGSGSLGEKAVVKGDLVTVGGSFTRADGSRVEGEIREDPTIEIPAPVVPEAPKPPEPVDVNAYSPLGQAIQALIMAIVMGLLAMALVLFMQPQMDRVAQTAIRQPLVAGGAGLLAFFAILVMFITIILIPVALLAVFILLPLAWVLGIVSLGMEFGERFTRAIDQTWPPALSAGFGTFLGVLIVGGLGVIPCLGGMVQALVALVGVGAVALTMFGSRPYPPVMAGPVAGAPAPASALDPGEPLPPTS